MSKCSLNCGYFHGVSGPAFAEAQNYLEGLFRHVYYDAGTDLLELTGGTNFPDEPSKLMELFDKLSLLLTETGKGRIMIQCELSEICYFRKGMWKLLGIHVPPDPFDDIHYAG